jgi:hypothetical protein
LILKAPRFVSFDEPGKAYFRWIIFIKHSQFQEQMLKYLKNLFGKEKEPQTVIVSEAELKGFLIEEKKIKAKALTKHSDECINAITEVIAQTKVLLLGLESAELHNKKITGQEMNFMVGNRKTYIKNTRDFLDRIEKIMAFDLPEEISDAISSAKKQVDILSKNNIRPYSVMQHFFANESRIIGNKIKDIIIQYELLEKYFTDSGITQIDDVLRLVEEKEEKDNARKKLEDEINAKKEQITENISSLKKARAQLKKLEDSSDFSDFKRICLEKERIAAELKHLENELLAAFDPIDSALKKYSRVALDNEIIESIIRSPVAAVSMESRKIVPMLVKLYEAVSKETIELKDRKKDRVLSAINKLSQEYFDSFIKKHEALKKEKHETEEKLRQNGIMRDYEDLQYRIKHLETREGILKTDIENIEKKVEKIERIEFDSDDIDKLCAITGKSIEIKS